MAAIPSLPTLGSDATLEEVRDQLAILQKTITFALTSNLGSQNAYEFGNWLVTPDSLISENGTVGFSTAITGGDDIRIWAGDESTNLAPFRVYESGHVYASNLTMVGGSIDWGAVVKPVYTPDEVGAIAANQDAVFDVLTNFGESQGLFLDSATNQLYINATYINTGIMTAIQIRTGRPEDGQRIEMYQNQLTTYNNSNQREGLVLGYNPGGSSSYGDVSFFNAGVREMIIYNTIIDGFQIMPTNSKVLFLGAPGHTTQAVGNWNFSGVTVSNLNVIAKFG